MLVTLLALGILSPLTAGTGALASATDQIALSSPHRVVRGKC